MISVFGVILPVFLVVGAGYAAVRIGGFAATAVDGLLAFTVRFAVPTLLCLAMYRLDLGAAFSARLLISFYAGMVTCFALGVFLSRRVWGRRPGEAVAVGFGAMFSNTVLLGIPIAERAFGDAVLPSVFAIIAIHAPLGYTLGITTMEVVRRDGAGPLETAKRTLRTIFSNALAIGLALGLALNGLGVVVPGPIIDAADMVADAAIPAALFGLGGALTRYAIRAGLAEASAMAVLSIVAHPLIAYVLTAHVFGLTPDQVRGATVIAAMPTGMNGYVFANFYHRAEGAAAGTVLIATGASIVTASAWLWFLG